MQVAVQEVLDILSGLLTDVSSAIDLIGSAINNATNSLGALNSIGTG